MIRLRKVRPYVASQETTFMLTLYDYEQFFQLVLNEQLRPVDYLDIIYDGGGVKGEEVDCIVSSEKPVSEPSRVDNIIYDGGGVVGDDDIDYEISDDKVNSAPRTIDTVIYDGGGVRLNEDSEMEAIIDGNTNY